MSNSPVLNKEWLVALMAASLTACGGGGGGDNNPPPSGSQPPPAQPAPPPPPPPPPPASTAPPLSSTVTDLTDRRRIGEEQWADGNTATGADGSTIDGMTCSFNLPDGYDVYAFVGVYLNGELLAIPNNVGVVPMAPSRCFYPIHTDDESGLVHVKWSSNDGFTLGELFRIWGQPLTDTNVAGLTGMPVEVFVAENGTVTEVETGWDGIELTSKKTIHIVVGTPVTELHNITWTGN